MLLRSVGLAAGLRLALTPPDTGRTALDGAWWPYSTGLADQAPHLLALFDTPAAPVRRIIVHAADWTGQPPTIALGPHRVVVHRLATLFPHMMFVEGDIGHRVDLLVIPPDTTPAVAEIAMTMATDPTNTIPAPRILATAATRATNHRPRPPAS